MKHYIFDKNKHFDIFQHKVFNPWTKKSMMFGQLINEYSIGAFREKDEARNLIYQIFEDAKIKYKDFEWVWDENYEHYELDEILVVLNKLWNDLDIKKELLFITSDIHTDYPNLFPYGDFYFTLHNMRLHHRRKDFITEYNVDCKYKFFLQGGSLRIDRTYIGEQFKKFIPDEFYISTISDNPHNQGADSSGKMKYTYKEMFDLMNDSNIVFVNETIRPPDAYFNGNFEGKATGYTEKTGNAIVLKKPFFLNSNPYSLYNLRELGFKTFSDYWDESYDEKLNQVDRLDGIIQDINWLSKVNEGGFHKLNRRLREITEHNYKHLTEEMTVYEGLRLFKPSEFNFKK